MCSDFFRLRQTLRTLNFLFQHLHNIANESLALWYFRGLFSPRSLMGMDMDPLAREVTVLKL